MMNKITWNNAICCSKHIFVATVRSRFDGLAQLAPHLRIVKRANVFAPSFIFILAARRVHALALLAMFYFTSAPETNTRQHTLPLGFLS